VVIIVTAIEGVGILLGLVSGLFIGVMAASAYMKAKQQTGSAVLQTQLDAANQRLQRLEQKLAEKQQQLHELQALASDRQADVAALKEKAKGAEDNIRLLDETKQVLAKDFELLANRIFQEKTKSFNETSKTTLDGAINPLREQLSDFKKKVDHVYDVENKERASLKTQLEQLKSLNIQMSQDAVNLTNALKGDNKAQGNWGEVILERVLEESGLHKGREYETQVSLKSSDGRRRNPDVIVRLPENKDIIIDSKVSLLDYERYCNSTDEEERAEAIKQHVLSVRSHINNLSFKDYENLEGINSLDFVFIFIPIEAAFMAAFEHDQAMFKDAYEKNIIVVSPTTLLATLRTVQSIWRYERQNKNAEEIARQGGALHDKFVGFIDDLDKIAEHINKAGEAHANALKKLSTGRGNLVISTQKLQKLGAKTKKTIPDSVVEQLEESEILDDDSLIESVVEDADIEH
jgi:DNA recombination protein RmuC